MLTTLLLVESLDGESIISGILTPDDDLQYMVSLLYQDEPLCSAGIIGERHILTAAHCVIFIAKEKFRDGLAILAGTHDVSLEYYDYETMIKVAVEKVYVPSIYNSSVWGTGVSPEGDIAVLKVTYIKFAQSHRDQQVNKRSFCSPVKRKLTRFAKTEVTTVDED